MTSTVHPLPSIIEEMGSMALGEALLSVICSNNEIMTATEAEKQYLNTMEPKTYKRIL